MSHRCNEGCIFLLLKSFERFLYCKILSDRSVHIWIMLCEQLYCVPILKCFFTQEAEEVVLWMNTVGPYHNRYLININSIFIITILILISSMDDTAIYVSIPQTRNIWLLYFALLPGDEGGDIPLSRDHRRGTSGEEFSLFYTFVFLYFCISMQGTELEFSGLAIEFRVDTAKTTYCQVSKLENSISFSSSGQP